MEASTTPTPTPVSTQDESTALSDATPESAESSELTENKETDSDSNAEIPAEVSAFSNDLAVEEVSLYDASGTSAQDAVTSWTELKSAVASAANGATIYLSGEITIPLDEVLSVSKNLRLVGTGSAQYTNTVGVGSETVAQGYTYTQNASLRMGDASGVQTDHDNVMIYISGGTTLEIENVFLNGNNNCENVVYTEGTQSEARVSFTVRVQSVVMGNSVSNRASVQYREDKITLPTDEVTTNVEPGKITVTKKLPASDLLAAHGAPVFTFTLTDAKGRVQRQSVQLSLDAEPDENGDVCASVTFTGLSGGVYTVIESQTVCHALVQFEDAENGTAKADCAVLELTGCRASASVTARNVRQSWAEDRDCALIVNEITPKQDNS